MVGIAAPGGLQRSCFDKRRGSRSHARPLKWMVGGGRHAIDLHGHVTGGLGGGGGQIKDRPTLSSVMPVGGLLTATPRQGV